MSEALKSRIDDLESDIDDLEENLAPLLNVAFSTSTSKLPLLDKAKFYVLSTYALESLIFSYLRLNGVDAKIHPIFAELARVKQYFEKIKVAESAGLKRNTTLDKGAAARFIKHALSGNDQYDQDRASRTANEAAGTKRKLDDFTQKHNEMLQPGRSRKTTRSSQVEATDGTTIDDGAGKTKKAGRARDRELSDGGKDVTTAEGESEQPVEEDSSKATKRKKSKKAPKGAKEAFNALLEGPQPNADSTEETPNKKKRKRHGEKHGATDT